LPISGAKPSNDQLFEGFALSPTFIHFIGVFVELTGFLVQAGSGISTFYPDINIYSVRMAVSRRWIQIGGGVSDWRDEGGSHAPLWRGAAATRVSADKGGHWIDHALRDKARYRSIQDRPYGG
jgi:hypothetical protein